MTPEESRKEELRIMSHPKMQERFREAMGPLLEGDRVYSKVEEKIFTMRKDGVKFMFPELHILLPLPIDPDHPERGLWGMVERIETLDQVADGFVVWVSENRQHFHGDTPRLALLKALAHQWQIDVEVA